MEELILELKQEIISVLNLEGMQPDEIDSDAPLFGDEGLALDSIDALELELEMLDLVEDDAGYISLAGLILDKTQGEV